MNYVWHTRINTLLLIAFALILGYEGSFEILGIELILGHGGGFEIIGIALFFSHGMLHTVLLSPDMDHKNSRPTQRLGLLGKITSFLFKHRGILHNPYAWTALYLILYGYIDITYSMNLWWMSGGLAAIYSHVVVDYVSTKCKRKIRAIKRKLHF